MGSSGLASSGDGTSRSGGDGHRSSVKRLQRRSLRVNAGGRDQPRVSVEFDDDIPPIVVNSRMTGRTQQARIRDVSVPTVRPVTNMVSVRPRRRCTALHATPVTNFQRPLHRWREGTFTSPHRQWHVVAVDDDRLHACVACQHRGGRSRHHSHPRHAWQVRRVRGYDHRHLRSGDRGARHRCQLNQCVDPPLPGIARIRGPIRFRSGFREPFDRRHDHRTARGVYIGGQRDPTFGCARQCELIRTPIRRRLNATVTLRSKLIGDSARSVGQLRGTRRRPSLRNQSSFVLLTGVVVETTGASFDHSHPGADRICHFRAHPPLGEIASGTVKPDEARRHSRYPRGHRRNQSDRDQQFGQPSPVPTSHPPTVHLRGRLDQPRICHITNPHPCLCIAEHAGISRWHS